MVSEEIIKILDDLGKRFGVVIDWSSENVLPYLQDLAHRFIMYKNAINIFWIVIGVIVILISLKIFMWSIYEYKNSEAGTEDREDAVAICRIKYSCFHIFNYCYSYKYIWFISKYFSTRNNYNQLFKGYEYLK